MAGTSDKKIVQKHDIKKEEEEGWFLTVKLAQPHRTWPQPAIKRFLRNTVKNKLDLDSKKAQKKKRFFTVNRHCHIVRSAAEYYVVGISDQMVGS